MDKNYLVTKSNYFIMNSSYDLSLEEQKIILTLASMVQPSDEEFKPYEFRISDFIELLGVENQAKYTEIPKITKELMKKVFEIHEGNKIIQVAWLSSAEYEKGTGFVNLEFSPKLKPYMLQLKEKFTQYQLANVLTMKSKYSPRVYEILKCNEFKKQGYIEIEVQELRKLLKAENIYPLYNDFKRKIVQQTQKELKKLSDINFEFEEIKTGRKVTSLKFYIKSNMHSKTKPIDEVSVALDSNNTDKDKKVLYEAINAIKSIFKESIDDLDAKKLLDAANGNINIIREKYELAQKSKKINNLVGWIITAIKEDYKVQSKENVDTFNNYQQRNYDFDKLEKELLSWEKNYGTNGEEYEQEKINQD